MQISNRHPSEAASPIAIVTGGSRGIGASLVERLHRDGWGVLFTHAQSPEEADALERTFADGGPVVRGLRCDVAERDAPARIFAAAEALGDPVALVNNAGITGGLGPLAELGDDELERVIAVNLAGPARLCREAARRWQGRSLRSSIVNVSSVAARTGSPNEYVVYAAAKAGLEALTRGLAKELAGANILVNAVSPGTTDTTIHARSGEPDRARRVAANIPLGRPGQPAEIANAIAWLLTAETSYVTGSVIEVTGGL